MTSHYLFIYLFQFPFYRQKTKDYEVNLMHAFSNDIIFHSNIPSPHPTFWLFHFAFLSSILVKYRKVNLGEAFCLFIFFHSPHSLFNGLHSFLLQGKQRIALGYDLYMVN